MEYNDYDADRQSSDKRKREAYDNAIHQLGKHGIAIAGIQKEWSNQQPLGDVSAEGIRYWETHLRFSYHRACIAWHIRTLGSSRHFIDEIETTINIHPEGPDALT